MLDKRIRSLLNFPAEKNEAARPELNYFAVQMVSPLQLFCVFDLSFWYDYPLAKINCMKFCLNFMQKEGNHIRYFIKYPRRIIEAARPELNCFAVQMVSPPHFFLRFYLFCLMCLSACWKKCAKFYLKFRTERKNYR